MLNFISRALLGIFVLSFINIAGAQQEIVSLNPPQPVENDGKVEVLEFFSYACPHCDHLDKPLSIWATNQPADVKFRRVPVDGISGYVGGVALYYTLEAMGEIDRLHSKIFDGIHREHVILAIPAVLNKWLAMNGVDVGKFEAMKSSFSVATKVQRAQKMNLEYKIAGVPTIVVNGRTQILSVGEPPRMLSNLDQVLRQVRAAASSATPTGKAAIKK